MNRLRESKSVWGLGIALSVLLSGCAKRPYYSGFYFDSPPLVETDRSEMVRYLDWMLQSQKLKKVTLVTPEKGVQSLLPRDETSPGTTDWIPLPLLFAARFVLSPKYRGLEVDLLAKTEAEGYTPVSAIHELDGSVRLEMGPSFRDLVPENGDQFGRDALCKRYHIGGIDDGNRNWTKLELYALGQALSLLRPDELAVLRGVHFVRNARAVESSKGLALHKVRAQYHGTVHTGDGHNDAREIHLFDTNPAHDTSLFVGEPSHPYPIPTMALLHEIGHAVADYVRIQAYWRFNQTVDSYNALVAAWNQSIQDRAVTESARAELDLRLALAKKEGELARQALDAVKKQERQGNGSVLAAFRTARGSEKGPTEYGGTDVEESFAECFALAKADPQALKRIYPPLADWFADAEHLRPLLPLLPPQKAAPQNPDVKVNPSTPAQKQTPLAQETESFAQPASRDGTE